MAEILRDIWPSYFVIIKLTASCFFFVQPINYLMYSILYSLNFFIISFSLLWIFSCSLLYIFDVSFYIYNLLARIVLIKGSITWALTRFPALIGCIALLPSLPPLSLSLAPSFSLSPSPSLFALFLYLSLHPSLSLFHPPDSHLLLVKRSSVLTLIEATQRKIMSIKHQIQRPQLAPR